MVQRPAHLCIKVPDQLSHGEAATTPVVYVTVLMFLVEKWKLSKAQSILIHGAAGGKVHFLYVSICADASRNWHLCHKRCAMARS